MTLDQKNALSLVQIACNEASFDTNCLDLTLEINVLEYVLYK